MTTHEDKPTLVSIVAVDGYDERTLLGLAASVARGLEPPVGAAILDSAREREVVIAAVDRLHETAGVGVAASIAGHTVVVGNAALFADLRLSIETLSDWPERLRQHGQHVLFVAVDGSTVGFLGLADPSV